MCAGLIINNAGSDGDDDDYDMMMMMKGKVQEVRKIKRWRRSLGNRKVEHGE